MCGETRLAPAVLVLVPLLAIALQAAPEEVPSFEETCFDGFDASKGYPGLERLQRMLRPVPRHVLPEVGGRISATKYRSRPACTISGLLRLVPPWQADSVLRLALMEPKRVQLHFFNGREGVTLRYYPEMQRTWAAYGTTRSGGRPQPETYALWAVDNGRYYRSRAGTFEVRWQDGKLVMTRGDLVLLCVPLSGPPREVFLEGTAHVRGLAVLHGKGVRSKRVPLPTVSRPVVLRVEKPAELDWRIRPPEGNEDLKLNKLPDGRVELTAKGNATTARAVTTVCRPGLYEYLFEIEDADPGTGIYLANKQSEQPYRLAFSRHRETGRTTFDVLSSGANDTERSYDFNKRVTPFAGKHQWIRLIVGAGAMRCFTSGDGVHFSEIRTDAVEAKGPVTDVGLFCLAGDQRRTIKLRSIELRRLDLLSSLAPEDVMQRVGPLGIAFQGPGADTIEQWQQRVAESRPIDVPPRLWTRACCLWALTNNPSRAVGQGALHHLLQDVLAEEAKREEGREKREERGEQEKGPALPGEEERGQQQVSPLSSLLPPPSSDGEHCRKLLDEACLLVFFHNYGDFWNAPHYGEYYRQLARRLTVRGHRTPWTTASRAIMRMPGWSIHADPFPQDLVHYELLLAAQEYRWGDLADFCRRIKFWTRLSEHQFYWLPWGNEREATTHLINWGEAIARGRKSEEGRERRRREGVRAATGLSSLFSPPSSVSWRHPLIEQLDKETFNVFADLCGALDAKAYRAACRIITLAPVAGDGIDGSWGLVTDRLDRQLLVSLPVAVDLAFQRYPPLRQTMREEFGPLGQLRAEKAMADGDTQAVEAVTRRFCTTQAAGEAHRWLGDRLMSWGRFEEAIGEYRRALRSVSVADRQQVQARLRLAAAMTGREVGQPAGVSVSLGDTSLPAAEVERLVQQALQNHGRRGDQRPFTESPTHPLTLSPCPPPGNYELRPWGRIDGDKNTGPGGPARADYDWAGRQIDVTIGDREVIVNNQFRRFALDFDGRLRWQKRQDAAPQKTAWSPMPMHPVLIDRRIIVRCQSKKGPELACLDADVLPGEGGQRLWTFQADGPVVCDPLLLGAELMTMTIDRSLGQLALKLVVLSPETGELLRQATIARFHDRWPYFPKTGTIPCRAAAVEGHLVATVGGAVLCCDPAGVLPGEEVRWVRRQVWTPPPEKIHHARRWTRQVHEIPLVADGRVWASQQGVQAIECIDLETGRLLWRTALPELVALAGRVGPRLIVEMVGGLLAVEADSGKVLWRHDTPNRLDMRLCGSADAVCYARIQPKDKSPQKPNGPPELVWIDPETGSITATSTLDIDIKGGVLLGPLFVHAERQWIGIAARTEPTKREIRELVRVSGEKR